MTMVESVKADVVEEEELRLQGGPPIAR